MEQQDQNQTPDNPQNPLDDVDVGQVVDQFKGQIGDAMKNQVVRTGKSSLIGMVIGLIPMDEYRRRQVRTRLMRGENISLPELFFGKNIKRRFIQSVIGFAILIVIFVLLVVFRS